MNSLRALCFLFAAALPAAAADAQDSSGVDDVAAKLQDPGAALVSVPFQYNYLASAGPGGDYDNQQLKVQPVIPFIGESGKFLLRPILPYQWNEFPEDRHGFGDLFVQGYYIPTRGAEGKATELGFGAAAMLDTAGHDSLGTGKYSLGPAFVVVRKAGKWTLGALANHVWSIGGDRDRDDVALTSMQPFVAYTLGRGWAINTTSEMSYNWEAASGDRWAIPLGATVSRVVPIGHMPVSFALGGFYNVERPEYANRWTARFTVTLVFPE
jgi:hypothetical protein